MTPAEADRQNVEDFANESADLLRRALAEAARGRAEEWERVTSKPVPIVLRQSAPAKRAKSPERSKTPFRSNGRRAAVVEINGERKTISGWCQAYGVDEQSVRRRLRRGTPIEVALKARKFARIDVEEKAILPTGGRVAILADQLRTGVVHSAQDCL